MLLLAITQLDLTIKTPKRNHWHSYDVIIVNFQHISRLVLMFILLPLSR